MPPKIADRLTKDELNLSEYPFALLSDRNTGAAKTMVCKRTRRDVGGIEVESTWTVTGSDAYGLPTAGDEAVYLALMQIAKDQGFKNRTVEFTSYGLLQRLGMDGNGRDYNRLKSSFLRLKTVSLIADNAFYDIAGKQYRTLAFGILDGFSLSTIKGEKCYADFNRHLWGFIEAGSIKSLDLGLYLSLNGYVARRLFRYLDRHTYDGKPVFSITLETLAFDHLGMPRHYAPSKVKRFLDSAHVELVESGFLAGVSYRLGKDGDQVVTYRFIKDKESSDRRALLDQMVTAGVSANVARDLASTYRSEDIRKHLKALPGLPTTPRNPGGWLRSAITSGYAHETAPKAHRGGSTPLPVLEVVETGKVPSEVILEARSRLGDSVVDEIERRVTDEVLRSPMYRGREIGKGARLTISQRLAAELEILTTP